jgi:hypothetical protein
MRQISHRGISVRKRLLPAAWFTFLAAFLALTASVMISSGTLVLPLLLVPVTMAVLGYFLIKHLLLDLVDEVWDAGDALIIKNGGAEETVPVTDVLRLAYSTTNYPTRITLTLRRPCRFGSELAFAAPVHHFSFRRSPVIDELIRRIDAARGSRPDVSRYNSAATDS